MLRLEMLVYTFSALCIAAKAELKARNCSETREACVARGFSFTHVPLQEIPGKTAMQLEHQDVYACVCSRGGGK